MASITDELREWAKTLTHWWYDPVKDEYTYMTGIMPPSIDAIRLDSNILTIADRIDAEHEKAIRELNNLADASVLLPVDADGVPIHIWDVLDPPTDCDDYMPLQVVRLTYDGDEDEWYFDGQAGGFTGMVGKYMDVAGWTHHRAPTVEDVLREFTDRVLEWAKKSGSVAEVGTWSDVAAEYAKRLRLAGDSE